jgi:hypothetical protein
MPLPRRLLLLRSTLMMASKRSNATVVDEATSVVNEVAVVAVMDTIGEDEAAADTVVERDTAADVVAEAVAITLVEVAVQRKPHRSTLSNLVLLSLSKCPNYRSCNIFSLVLRHHWRIGLVAVLHLGLDGWIALD